MTSWIHNGTIPFIIIWTPVGSAPAVKINSPDVIGLEITVVCKKSILKAHIINLTLSQIVLLRTPYPMPMVLR